MKNKVLSLILVFSMLFSVSMPQGFVYADEEDKSIEKSVALDNLLKQVGNKFEDDDQISIIVQINDDIMSKKHNMIVPDIEGIKSESGLSDRIAYAKESQYKLYDIMDDLGLNYKITQNYETVLNGFALRTSFKEAKIIANLEEVKNVDYNRIIPAPQIKKANIYHTRDASSNAMVEANKAWQKNYTGKGQFIAVIDSGTDPAHEIFSVNPDGAKVTENEINDIINSGEVSKGKFFSKKIPFGFNYAERNQKIKQEGDVSHGQHVAGIIAGNSPNGDKIKGVAPDAQLAIMRVFGGGMFGGGTTPEIYNKAIDDAVKLGVDSINMSLGATNTTDSRMEETTIESLRNAQKAGIVVAVAAGNDGFMGFGVLDGPNPNNPNYGSINSPSVADISMSVASVDNTYIREKAILIEGLDRQIMFVPTDDKAVTQEYLSFVHVSYGYEDDYETEDNKSSDTVTEESIEEVKEKASEEVKEKASEEVKAEASEEVKEEASEEVKEEASEEVKAEASEEVKAEASEEVKAETSEEVKEESSEEVKEESSEEVKEESSEEVKEVASEEVKEEASEEVKEEASEEVKEETSENTKEELIKELSPDSKVETKSTGLDLSGKYALIKRGEREGAGDFTFYDKVKIAQNHGAIGVIVYDNKENGALFSMAGLDKDDITIPSFFISKEDGEFLVKNPNLRLKVSTEDKVIANPTGYGLSNFSSWGMTEEGNFKPDISAPGGKIYSSINNQKYQVMSGTSMATPHVCGGIAIVDQYVEKTFPTVQGEDKHILVKNILMSSATPHQFDSGAYGSPRGQGAGLMSLNKAINTDVVILGTNGISSINLRDIKGNTVTVSGTLKNYSNEDRTFEYHAVLNSDKVEEGHITLEPRFIEQTSTKSITVGANATKEFTVEFLLSDNQIASLKNDMPNGYFLEGYVFFDSARENISVPFVGFKGVEGKETWDDIAVIEESIYDLLLKNEKPMYYEFADRVEDPFTYIATKVGANVVPLGEDLKSTYENPLFKKENIAFSPNDDGSADEAHFVGTFLRNYRDFEMAVYAKDDASHSNPIFRLRPDSDEYGIKNYFVATPFGGPNFNQTKNRWAWDGTVNPSGSEDGTDEVAPNGDYTMVIGIKGDSKDGNNKVQHMEFPVKLDTVYPRIKKSSYDAQSHKYTLEQVIEDGSGIREVVILSDKLDDEKKPIEYTADENGVFTLDSKVDIEKARIKISDYAFNTIELPLNKSIKTGNERMLIVNPVLEHGVVNSDQFDYKVLNMQDEEVDPYDLQIGNYKIVVEVKDPDLLLIGSNTINFEITDKDFDKIVNINFKRRGKGKATVSVANKYNANLSVFIVNKATGEDFELAPYMNGGQIYEGFVAPGEYKVVVRDLDRAKFYVVSDKDGAVLFIENNSVGTGKALTNIEVLKRNLKDSTINVNRNGYTGAFTLRLIGKDFDKTAFNIRFEAGENSKTVKIQNKLDFEVYTDSFDAGFNYGTERDEAIFNFDNNHSYTVNLEKDKVSDTFELDKELLNIYIKKGLSLKEKEYVLESWQIFEKVLYDAQKLTNNASASQEDVFDMTNELREAIDGLLIKVEGADKDDLAKKIKEAEEIFAKVDDKTYTEDSITFLAAAIEGAKLTYKSKDPKHNTEKHISDTINMLDRAIANLTRIDGKLDFSAIEFLLDEADEVLDNESIYKADGIENLKKEYQAAKDLMAADPDDVTKSDINLSKDLLRQALASIESKADRKALQDLVTECDNVNLLDKELDCRNPFRKALNLAKRVLKDKKSSQEIIDKAFDNLSKKYGYLYPIGGVNPNPNPDEDDDFTIEDTIRRATRAYILKADMNELSMANEALEHRIRFKKPVSSDTYTAEIRFKELTKSGITTNVEKLILTIDGNDVEASPVDGKKGRFTFAFPESMLKENSETDTLIPIKLTMDKEVSGHQMAQEAVLVLDWNDDFDPSKYDVEEEGNETDQSSDFGFDFEITGVILAEDGVENDTREVIRIGIEYDGPDEIDGEDGLYKTMQGVKQVYIDDKMIPMKTQWGRSTFTFFNGSYCIWADYPAGKDAVEDFKKRKKHKVVIEFEDGKKLVYIDVNYDKDAEDNDGNDNGNEDEEDEGIDIPSALQDGEYTLTYKIYEKDSNKETLSMMNGYFDKKAKLVVENGKNVVSVLNTEFADVILDMAIMDGTSYKPMIKKVMSDKKPRKIEYTMEVDKLTELQDIAVLLSIDGDEGDISNYAKYKKADVEFLKVKSGWKGYAGLNDSNDSDKPDEAALVNALIEHGVDTNNDGQISPEELMQAEGLSKDVNGQPMNNVLDLEGLNIPDITILKDLGPKVKVLNLNRNLIDNIPNSLLSNATGLEYVILSNNHLSTVPSDLIKNSPKLRKFDLSGNIISELSEDFFIGQKDSRYLEEVDLSSNHLAKIPSSLADAKYLRKIDASNNEITHVPAILAKLKSLLDLNLEGNRIDEFPIDIVKGMIERAKTNEVNLDLSLNNLKTVPVDELLDALKEGKALNKFDLDRNYLATNLSDVEKAFLKKLGVKFTGKTDVYFPQKQQAEARLEASDGKILLSQRFDILEMYYWLLADKESLNSNAKDEFSTADEFKTYYDGVGRTIHGVGQDVERAQAIQEILKNKDVEWKYRTIIAKNNGTIIYDKTSEIGVKETGLQQEYIDNTMKSGEEYTIRKILYVKGIFGWLKQFEYTAKCEAQKDAIINPNQEEIGVNIYSVGTTEENMASSAVNPVGLYEEKDGKHIYTVSFTSLSGGRVGGLEVDGKNIPLNKTVGIYDDQFTFELDSKVDRITVKLTLTGLPIIEGKKVESDLVFKYDTKPIEDEDVYGTTGFAKDKLIKSIEIASDANGNEIFKVKLNVSLSDFDRHKVKSLTFGDEVISEDLKARILPDDTMAFSFKGQKVIEKAKSVNLRKIPFTLTFTDGSTLTKNIAGNKPVDPSNIADGEYTVAYHVYKDGSNLQDVSSLEGFFDKRAKLVVKDGKKTISLMNFMYADMILDFAVMKDGEFKTMAKNVLEETNKGVAKKVEYTFEANNLEDVYKLAVLGDSIMGGNLGDLGDYDNPNYKKTDLVLGKITEGWTTYQKIEEEEISDSQNNSKLIQALIAQGVDTNDDGIISKDELMNAQGEPAVIYFKEAPKSNMLDLRRLGLVNIDMLKDLGPGVKGLLLDEGNSIEHLPKDVFKNAKGLEYILLSGNDIDGLDKDLFANNPKLKEVTFDGCNLGDLPAGLFRNNPKLRVAAFMNAGLTSVPADLVKNCPNLRELYLSENKIKHLDDDFFIGQKGSRKFNSISLSDNELDNLPSSLGGITGLREINAMHNKIKAVPVSLADLPVLSTLDLEDNEIEILPAELMRSFIKKSKTNVSGIRLDFSMNNLKSLPISEMLEQLNSDGKRLVKFEVDKNYLKVDLSDEEKAELKSLGIDFEVSQVIYYPQKHQAEAKAVAKDGKIELSQRFDVLEMMYWTLGDSKFMNNKAKDKFESADEFEKYLLGLGRAINGVPSTLDRAEAIRYILNTEKNTQWKVRTVISKNGDDLVYDNTAEANAKEGVIQHFVDDAMKKGDKYSLSKTLLINSIFGWHPDFAYEIEFEAESDSSDDNSGDGQNNGGNDNEGENGNDGNNGESGNGSSGSGSGGSGGSGGSSGGSGGSGGAPSPSKNDAKDDKSKDKDTSIDDEKTPLASGKKASSIFDDVSENAWYHDDVSFAIKNKLFVGTSERTFSPQMNLSRAMFVTVLYRLDGEKEGGTFNFTDVKDNMYYSKALAWAASSDYVSGYKDNTFRPDNNISREEFIAILYRYAKADVTDKTVLNKFSDSESVSEWAKDSMSWAVEEGIIKGSDGKLNPKSSTTRAEAAAILKRFINR